MTTARAVKAPAAWRSGFCATGNPRASHTHCRGGYQPTDGTLYRACVCHCHQETTMTDTTREVVTIPTRDGDLTLPVPARQPLDGQVLDLPAAVDGLAAAAEVLSHHALDKHVTGIDWQDAVRMLDRLRHATDLIGSVRDALVLHVYLTGEHGDQEVEGVKGLVKIARGRERREWEVDRAARAVVDARMDALEGEQPDPLEVVDWLLEVLHVDYARVTPLRGMGLDPKEFCNDRPGKIGVTLPPR